MTEQEKVALRVLIELYWNVNEAYEHEYLGVPNGINRTILECK